MPVEGAEPRSALVRSGARDCKRPRNLRAVTGRAADDAPGEEIVVTGSRIRQTTGMESPNPVTVVTPAQLSVMAPTNLIEGLAELPQFYGSATTQTPSPFFTSTGAGSLNLRGLQSNRTLQLLDGRRVVESTIFGGPDINLFPENVVSRVETVTGGASAAYGTDAVAGVVNFVLDTNLEGLKANVQVGPERARRQLELQGLRRRRLLRRQAEEDPHPAQRGEGATGPDLEHGRAALRLVQGHVRCSPTRPPAPAAPGTTPLLIPFNDVRARGFDIDGIFYLPTAAGGPRSSTRAVTPSPFVLGSPCSNSGCSTTNGGSGHESGLQTVQHHAGFGPRERVRLRQARLQRSIQRLRPVHARQGRLHAAEFRRPVPESGAGRGVRQEFHDLQRQPIPAGRDPAGDDGQQHRVGSVQPNRRARRHREPRPQRLRTRRRIPIPRASTTSSRADG